MGLRKCVICGKEIKLGYGHNPAPLKESGRCCDYCDDVLVFPYRLAEATQNDELKELVMAKMVELSTLQNRN